MQFCYGCDGDPGSATSCVLLSCVWPFVKPRLRSSCTQSTRAQAHTRASRVRDKTTRTLTPTSSRLLTHPATYSSSNQVLVTSFTRTMHHTPWRHWLQLVMVQLPSHPPRHSSTRAPRTRTLPSRANANVSRPPSPRNTLPISAAVHFSSAGAARDAPAAAAAAPPPPAAAPPPPRARAPAPCQLGKWAEPRIRED